MRVYIEQTETGWGSIIYIVYNTNIWGGYIYFSRKKRKSPRTPLVKRSCTPFLLRGVFARPSL